MSLAFLLYACYLLFIGCSNKVEKKTIQSNTASLFNKKWIYWTLPLIKRINFLLLVTLDKNGVHHNVSLFFIAHSSVCAFPLKNYSKKLYQKLFVFHYCDHHHQHHTVHAPFLSNHCHCVHNSWCLKPTKVVKVHHDYTSIHRKSNR